MEYIETGGGGAEAASVTALQAEPDPIQRLRMVASESRQLWETGALELDRIISGCEIRDPRLVELQRRSLDYRMGSTRATIEVLFPDELRRRGYTIDDVAAFATAVDSAAVVTTLLSLGWTLDRWEAWVVELLRLFFEPGVVETR